jgi:hypothetical protein
MQVLPLGIQSFSEIRERNYLYVDKTQQISKLINSGKYFLSRPRRFGKSLMVSTIKEIYKGRKALFKGLWLEKNRNWEQIHPVIHLEFSGMGYRTIGLIQAIERALEKIGIANGHRLIEKEFDAKFEELIQKVGEKGKVVLLIDEYDKPLIDYLRKDELPKALEHQQILKSFYSVIKRNDDYIEFMLITGVSKFSKVSIFSELNNLTDISNHRNFSDLVGITQEEVENNFDAHLEDIIPYFETNKAALLTQIKEWYNGYYWAGKARVYNPYSLMSFLSNASFRNFWFETGTPTFLLNQIRQHKKVGFESIKVDGTVFANYDIANLQLIPLLFQTGYLTILGQDKFGLYELGYPNREVKESMLRYMIGEFRQDEPTLSTPLAIEIYQAFEKNDVKTVIQIIKNIFKNIPYQIFIADKEFYYHSLVYMIFLLLGQYVDCEVSTNNGRLDAVLKTTTHIYIIEFKLDESAAIALKQIKNKEYHVKYNTDKRQKVLVGINFSSESKSVNDWEVEAV